MLDPTTALVNIIVAAIGIISILFSRPTILFENLDEKEEKKELVEMERDFTEYTIKRIKQDRAYDFYYIDKLRESYNSVIKIVGLLENTITQYNEGLLFFKRMNFLFGIFLLIAAAFSSFVAVWEYTTLTSLTLVFNGVVGTILFTIIITSSFRLNRTVKSYREYKKVLRQQRTNILFREIEGS